jgi:hypothetical protein
VHVGFGYLYFITEKEYKQITPSILKLQKLKINQRIVDSFGMAEYVLNRSTCTIMQTGDVPAYVVYDIIQAPFLIEKR